MYLNLEKFKNRIVDKYTIKAREGIYVKFPETLHKDIKDYLSSKNIFNLYNHQAEMFEKSMESKNIIITTSTASGKTLSFLLPVINKILNNPSTRAIFIYPTKALTSDQFKSLLPIIEYFGKDRISAGIYDGDTPATERIRIRKEANIILTNPEMINGAFLPSHNKHGFDFIFKNLDFVVIDELHYYRGAFGSHIANIMRRMKRICNFYNSTPQFFCSTATISNPLELAENVFGSPFILIDKDGSPRGEKEIYFWVPPIIKNTSYRISNEEEASNLLPELIIQNIKLIAFSSSRKELEVILKEVKEKMYDENTANLISGYRGGYKVEERKEIERKINNDILKAVIATNALELGIDIGNIDLVLSIGFPSTKASYFQQIGRAGRNGNKSYSILMLNLNKTYDNYISNNSKWIFESKIENAIIDKNNLYIQLAHIRASASELPLSLDDIKIFPNLGEILPVLLRNKEVSKLSGKFVWTGKDYPAGDYSLRTISEIAIKVINIVSNEFITELEEFSAYREVHPGAIYIHDGEMYLVESLNLSEKIAKVNPVNFNYYTTPRVIVNIHTINTLREEKIKNYTKNFGDLRVSSSITHFKKLQFHTHNNLGYEQLEFPFEKTIETEGVWISLPQKVSYYIDSLKELNGNAQELYFSGLCTLFSNAFKIRTMTSDNDIGSGMFVSLDREGIKIHNIAIYDNYIGGLGFSEKGYDLISEIIEESLEIIETCRCKNGCPACVGRDKIDKKLIIWAMKSFFSEEKFPGNVEKYEISNFREVLEKPFLIEEMEREWEEFIYILNKEMKSVSMVGFLSSIRVGKFEKNIVYLVSSYYIDNSLISDENILEIKGLIARYFDFTCVFNIEILNLESFETSKIERHYNNLIK